MNGLASMYPASDWTCCAPGHHGYQRAREGRSGNTVTTGGVTAAFPVQRGNIRAHEIQMGIRVGSRPNDSATGLWAGSVPQ